jgi:threonine dehydratase
MFATPFAKPQGVPPDSKAFSQNPSNRVSMPTLDDIRTAHARIRPYIHKTPALTSAYLSSQLGMEVFFKCENLQKAGAFKSRGACNAVFSLSDAEAQRGVLTHSSGNHAAALARAAAVRGIAAYIVMPKNAPLVKVAAVKHYGGKITFCEPTQAHREATALRIQKETGAVMVHPYDDERIIAGQGTAAVELLEDVPDLAAIITPVGGGGLLSGTAIAAKSLKDDIRVFGAEPVRLNDAFQSLKTGQIQPATGADSLADGLKTSLGSLTFPIIRELVDEILLTDESAIVEAMRMVFERMKLVVEPSGVVPLAAILQNRESLPSELAGRKVGVIFSGGNVDLSRLPFAETAGELP